MHLMRPRRSQNFAMKRSRSAQCVMLPETSAKITFWQIMRSSISPMVYKPTGSLGCLLQRCVHQKTPRNSVRRGCMLALDNKNGSSLHREGSRFAAVASQRTRPRSYMKSACSSFTMDPHATRLCCCWKSGAVSSVTSGKARDQESC